MNFGAGETVTRLRAATVTDPYSGEGEAEDWDSPTSATINGCAFDPGGSQEPLDDGRTAVITRPTVYAPADADVLSGDRLVVRGDTYEVQGRPALYRSPFTGWTPGLVVALELVEG